MKQFLMTLALMVGAGWTFHLSAITPDQPPLLIESATMSQTMTVFDFLALDLKDYRTAEGKKLKWTQRFSMGLLKKHIAKKVKNGKLEGNAPMEMIAAVRNPNIYGLLSIIFSIAGLVGRYYGLVFIVAGLVLGIVGIRRDADPTMAIIGTVLSGAILLGLLANRGWFWN